MNPTAPRETPEGSACTIHAGESCLTCAWRADAEWGVLSDEDLRRLDAARSFNAYRPGQVVYTQGHPALGVFCIESGEVLLRRTDEHGTAAVTALVPAGRALGYRALLGGVPYEETAEAASEARLCFIDRAMVRELLDKDCRLGHRFFRRVAEDLTASEQARIDMATLGVRQRFAHFLLTLKDRRGRVDADGSILLDLPLARQDIASLLGARPETVTRTVRALEEDGIATFDGRTVRIPDLDALLDELEERSGEPRHQR